MAADRSFIDFVPGGRLLRIPPLIGWFVLILLVSGAAATRFQIAPVPISEWDSWGWLDPALSWIGGTGFRERYEREWLYGAFVAACLRLTGSFSGYIIIQQVLGVLAGVLIWLGWRTWTLLFPRNAVFEVISVVAGLFVVAVYLFSPIAMAFELSIRPEGIMAFTAFLQLFCIASYARFRWHQPRPAASVIFGSLALPLAYSLFILKPNWLLAVPATTLPVFIGLFGRNFPRAARLLTPTLGLFLIVVTLWVPEKLLFVRTQEPRAVLPMTLFTIHADVIQESMRQELQSAGISQERRRFLEAFLPLLDREMQTARTLAKSYPRLGFDPDYLMYRSPVFPFLAQDWKMSGEEIVRFCQESFLSAVWKNPVGYARKVSTQLGYFVFPDQGTFYRKRLQLGNLYEYALTTLPESLNSDIRQPVRDLYDLYWKSMRSQLSTPQSLEVFRPFRSLLTGVRVSAFWIELTFFLSLTLCLLLRSFEPFRLPGLMALLFFFAPAGNALTIALIHALDNARYRGSYGPLLLFALMGMLFFVLRILMQAVIVARQRKP